MALIPALSIIIPVYRAPEVLLRRCLDSVGGQAGVDLEVILVDDASPDGCPGILDEYAARDARMKVIHRAENGRAGLARNDGLEMARGEYIWFVDADDLVPAGAAAQLVLAARAQQADTLVFSWRQADEQGRVLRRHEVAEQQYDLTWARDRAACLRQLHYALWNKLFRRQAVERLRFQSFPANIGEDTLYNVAALCRCQVFAVTGIFGYDYTLFSESATRRSGKGRTYLDTLQQSQAAMAQELVQAWGPEGRRYADWLGIKRFVTGCEWIAENGDDESRRELWRHWRKYFAEQLAPSMASCGALRFVFTVMLCCLQPRLAARGMRVMTRIHQRLH